MWAAEFSNVLAGVMARRGGPGSDLGRETGATRACFAYGSGAFRAAKGYVSETILVGKCAENPSTRTREGQFAGANRT